MFARDVRLGAGRERRIDIGIRRERSLLAPWYAYDERLFFSALIDFVLEEK